MSGMNKFVYGERTVYEKDGRYIKHLNGEFVGEDTRSGAFSWLYKGSAYELVIHGFAEDDDGVYLRGSVLNKESRLVISSGSFYKQEKECDNDVMVRLLDWASRYVNDSELATARERYKVKCS